MRRPAILIGLTGLAAVILASVVAEPAEAEYYYFPNQDDPTATRLLATATVRIFASESGEQMGSGFVIDGKAGLILTAAHVIRDLNTAGWDAWVAFPDASNRLHAKVLVPSSRDASETYDFSILKLDPPVADLHAIELQFDEIDNAQKHRVTGFGRSNSEPVQAEVQPSRTDGCSYTIRGQTLYGDSGSAIVTMQDLVDGIATDGAESHGGDSMLEMKVLPLSCIRNQILDVVPNDQSNKVMDIIWKGDNYALNTAFQPPQNGPGWVNNLRLAKALENWIVTRKTEIRPLNVDQKRVEEALRIIYDRRLGIDMVENFAVSDTATKRAAADALQDLGDVEIAQASSADAAAVYDRARGLYATYLAALQPAPWLGSTPIRNLESGGTYRAAADNMLKLARASGNTNYLEQAQSLAAAAVLAAPSEKLKASSWATLGAASNDAGNVAVAVPAYRAALDLGATASWISKGLEDAKAALGTAPHTNLTVDYLKDEARAVKNPL